MAVLALALAAGGCGYHVAGFGGRVPGDITSLSIPIFANRTAKPDIEGIITTAFVDEFNTTIEVGPSGEGIMDGIIVRYELRPVSFSESDINQEYRLIVSVELAIYRDGPRVEDIPEEDEGPEALWRDTVTDYEDFIVNIDDVAATRQAEADALRKIARDVARLTKERVLEDF